MTHPTLDEVIAALVPVLGAVRTDRRHAPGILSEPTVLWYFAGWCVCARDWIGTVDVKIDDGGPLYFAETWLVTRDGAPVDGDDTVTLDALPGLVRAACEKLGLGEAVAT